MQELEAELKQLIIDVLNLEDIACSDIASDDPLFGEGLGLDSIDALELGVAIRRKYEVKIDVDSEESREHFTSVSNLARFVALNRG